MLTHVHQVSSTENFRKACSNKRPITIASDGGLKGNKGTLGWVIHSAKNEMLIEGAGLVDGPHVVANSTRCKVGGYAASLLIITLLQTLWGTKHRSKFRWVTNNKAAIANVTQTLDDERVNKRQKNDPDFWQVLNTRQKLFDVE